MAQTHRPATTPFRSAFDGAIIEAQARIRAQQEALTGDSNASGAFDKYQLLRALTRARLAWGLSDRALTVLEALCSFQPGRMLEGAQPVIVFPSNAELSLRTRGMAPATLRRHLASLVKAGLLARRDSPNGKRYAARGQGGEVVEAYGFDLAPFALAAPDIHQEAERVEAAALALRRMRATITCHLRDIRAIVDAGLSERTDDPDTWSALADELGALSGRLPRNATCDELEPRREALARLHAKVERIWLAGFHDADLDDRAEIETRKMSANDAISERHIQNSSTEAISDISHKKARKRVTEREWQQNAKTQRLETKSAGPEGQGSDAGSGGEDEGAAAQAANSDPAATLPDRRSLAVPPLADVLAVCPQIAGYAKGGVNNWADLEAAADLVRTMLGISPSAWTRAKDIMGRPAAATVIAAMLERADDINSPGGYLRTLTARTQDKKFTLAPMLKALAGR